MGIILILLWALFNFGHCANIKLFQFHFTGNYTYIILSVTLHLKTVTKLQSTIFKTITRHEVTKLNRSHQKYLFLLALRRIFKWIKLHVRFVTVSPANRKPKIHSEALQQIKTKKSRVPSCLEQITSKLVKAQNQRQIK